MAASHRTLRSCSWSTLSRSSSGPTSGRRRSKLVVRPLAPIFLVPKLYLGTHLPTKLRFVLALTRLTRPKDQLICREREYCSQLRSRVVPLRLFPDRSEAGRRGRFVLLRRFGSVWSDRWSRRYKSAHPNLLENDLLSLVIGTRRRTPSIEGGACGSACRNATAFAHSRR